MNDNCELKAMQEHNANFVASKEFEKYITDKFPAKKIAIVTCMDTRLVELLPAALGIHNGDVKMIKNAGGIIDNPFDSAMRSILVAVYELGVNHIMVVGHTNCGVRGMNASHFKHLMNERGISEDTIRTIENCGINLNSWLNGFEETPQAVVDTMNLISQHPLLPPDVTVSGHVMDSTTGQLYSYEEFNEV